MRVVEERFLTNSGGNGFVLTVRLSDTDMTKPNQMTIYVDERDTNSSKLKMSFGQDSCNVLVLEFTDAGSVLNMITDLCKTFSDWQNKLCRGYLK